MKSLRLLAIVLLVAGTLGLAYGGFSYTRETTVAKLGPLELKAEEQRRVNVPLWAGIVAVLAGGALLVLPGRK